MQFCLVVPTPCKLSFTHNSPSNIKTHWFTQLGVGTAILLSVVDRLSGRVDVCVVSLQEKFATQQVVMNTMKSYCSKGS